MVGLAIGKFIINKNTDAKNLLKIISKKSYVSEYGDDFERAWLMYADSFIAVFYLYFRFKNMTMLKKY